MQGRTAKSLPMIRSAHALHEAFDHANALLTQAMRRAGQGTADPRFARQLDASERVLASGLDEAGTKLVRDVFEAARRVMESAEPEAPLLMLELARQNLVRAVRRQATRGWLRDAA